MLILKIILSLFSWGIFIYVIFNVPYPKSLTQASLFQLFSFFIPLFFVLIFTINLALKNNLNSILVSSGLIILITLKGLNSLNIVSGGLTIIAIGLILSYFKKGDSSSFIPKLRLLQSQTERSKLKNLRRKK